MAITEKQVNKWFMDEAIAEARLKGRDDIETVNGKSGGPDSWFSIGCCDWKDRETLMLIISAARQLCGMAPAHARKLLVEAVEQLDKRKHKRGNRSG